MVLSDLGQWEGGTRGKQAEFVGGRGKRNYGMWQLELPMWMRRREEDNEFEQIMPE